MTGGEFYYGMGLLLLNVYSNIGLADPQWVTDLLSYMCLVLREDRRHGGQSWKAYDYIFRNHVHQGKPWACLQTSFIAAYFPMHRGPAHLPFVYIARRWITGPMSCTSSPPSHTGHRTQHALQHTAPE